MPVSSWRMLKRRVRGGSRGCWLVVATLLFLSTLCLNTNVGFPASDELYEDFGQDAGEQRARRDWKDENTKTMLSLRTCLAEDSCSANQTSVVLLATPHFAQAIEGDVSGEDIWAASVLTALRDMGYTFLYSRNAHEALHQYRLIPDLVKVVLSEANSVQLCYERVNCVQSEDNPLGIPVWKMFSFHFWAGAEHPLGGMWTLSPEDYRNGNQYLGYSIEEACTAREMIPTPERDPQIYILGKRLHYFYHRDYAWDDEILGQIHTELHINILAGIMNDTDFDSWYPANVRNYGILAREEFYEVISRSHVLLGIGIPPLSPSPYDALCLGVPFINPILSWDENQPEDRSMWFTQHDGVKYFDPPFVYNVRKGDGNALVDAIKSAQANPIPRFIPAAMRQDAVRQRVEYLVENDWRSAAEDLLAHRMANGDGPEFYI